jgi:hypothetical protein
VRMAISGVRDRLRLIVRERGHHGPLSCNGAGIAKGASNMGR